MLTNMLYYSVPPCPTGGINMKDIASSPTIDIEQSSHVSLAEIEANLNGIVTPSQPKSSAKKACGSLSTYANHDKRSLEENAFAQAMAVKHASPASKGRITPTD